MHRRSLSPGALLMLLLLAKAASAQTNLPPAAAPRDNLIGANFTDIQYGETNGQKLLLDAHVPAGTGPFPVLLLVHGGGWRNGDKETDIVPVLAPAVTNFTWFTINYRLAPRDRWPAGFEDVQTAIRWVKQHAPEYKGDPARVALIGYSAGGHLVCLAATEAKADTRVQAVVGFAPPTDIIANAESRGGLAKWTEMTNLLGRVTLDEETLKTMRAISPSEHISAGLPPFLLVQGSADTSIPYNLTLGFEAKLQANHVSCDHITIDGASHRIAEWNNFHPGWATEVDAWLERQLKSNP